MDRLRKNIIANFFGKLWGAFSIYFFIPIYIQLIGIEGFGLVSFFATLQGSLVFADFGLTATLSREMSRLDDNSGDLLRKRNTLRTFEFIFSFFILSIILLLVILSDAIATRWLSVETLNNCDTIYAIQLMGPTFGFQLFGSLYSGGLMGMQQQVKANTINIVWGFVRGFGAILILWLVSPTVVAFFYWQIFANLIYTLATRYYLWKTLRLDFHAPEFRFDIVKDIRAYALGIAIISILSSAIIQMDKLVISKYFSLTQFGYYSIASTFSQIPVLLTAPISSAVFPMLTKYVSVGDGTSLTKLYHQAAKVVSLLTIPIGITIIFCSYEIILLWVRDSNIAQNSYLTASILSLGSLLLSFQVIPYHVSLAYGYTRLAIRTQLLSFFILLPLTFVLVISYGVIGGALSWLILNLIMLPVFVFFFHKKYLKNEFMLWLIADIGKPFLSVFLLIGILKMLISTILPNSQSLSVVIIFCASSVLTFFLLKKGINLKMHLLKE